MLRVSQADGLGCRSLSPRSEPTPSVRPIRLHPSLASWCTCKGEDESHRVLNHGSVENGTRWTARPVAAQMPAARGGRNAHEMARGTVALSDVTDDVYKKYILHLEKDEKGARAYTVEIPVPLEARVGGDFFNFASFLKCYFPLPPKRKKKCPEKYQ